jgi:hypothetical protein
VRTTTNTQNKKSTIIIITNYAKKQIQKVSYNTVIFQKCRKNTAIGIELYYPISSKIVTVHSEDTKTGVKFEEKFAGLHLHTGSLNLCNMRKTQFPNESAFKGKIAYGVRNDVSLKEMEGKDVVVIGWGAFSVDAIKRALVGGAKSIAVLYRTPRVHWFDYNTYLLDHEFFNPGAGNPAHVAATWESHFDAHRKGAAATSCSSLLDNSDLVRKVDGKDNMILSSSPTTSFDLVALGIHYGLVKPIRDTVKAFTSSGVSTDSGKEYHADIVFKCIGFDAETSLIKGHVLTDAWWIDGHPNLTSAINIDKVQGTYLVGPSSPGRDVFIMSYFTFHQISLIMAHYIKNPDKFEEYKKLPLFSTIVPSEYSNLMNIGPMISKVFASGQEVPIGIMVQCFLRTQELYGKHLPPGEFYRLDKAKWERMVDFFVAKTAKPKVEYPFPAFSF